MAERQTGAYWREHQQASQGATDSIVPLVQVLRSVDKYIASTCVLQNLWVTVANVIC